MKLLLTVGEIGLGVGLGPFPLHKVNITGVSPRFTVRLIDWGSAEAKIDKIAGGPTRDDGIPPMT
ncbi:hypothetical protein RBB77_09770 [Tunturibacter psychrotolerans]|uniref:Uncharacterized protein n=1 Tax=Tunturiibacter psychrotolerans TaxID=3069686 RepID=A0AAU7ZXJ8_9BACT